MNETTSVKNTVKKQFNKKQIYFGIFLVAAVAVAGLVFSLVRNFVLTWDVTPLGGVAVSDGSGNSESPDGSETTDNISGTPQAPAIAGPTPVPWDGANRVTVLLVGLDYRDWEAGEGPPRTDTMILLTLDPLTNTAGMLSIPRDLWVSIPGYGYGKINTAYQIGEGARLPGGGPALAMKTVEQFLGVPIKYYAQVDFSAFERFIDEIYGVKVTIPEKITIDIIDDDRGAITLSPGLQVLPGSYALAYARARNTEGGDFDRAQRQQQIIFAIRDRILSYDMIPTLVAKAPVLYQELSSGINTNMSLDEAFQLAWFAKEIPEENIMKGIIGTKHVTFGTSPDGLDILKPLPDQIRILRDQIFVSQNTLGPLASDGVEPLDLVLAENPNMKFLNGTLTPGIAGRTSEYFESLGMTVVVTADTDSKPYAYTEIYDYTGNPYTIQYLVEVMKISEYRIYQRFAPESEVDVAVIIGDDWVYNNPMP